MLQIWKKIRIWWYLRQIEQTETEIKAIAHIEQGLLNRYNNSTYNNLLSIAVKRLTVEKKRLNYIKKLMKLEEKD